jgi:putative membrane protein
MSVAASVAFLVSYLIYHATKQHNMYEGPARPLYFTLLITHVVLAAVNLPMIVRTVWLARKQDWERHKRWARRTYPIWLYVSASGVAVYVMLYLL